MTAIRFVFVAGLLGAGAIQAQSVPEIPFTVSCPLRHLPSQREIGDALGLDNFTQIYAERARVLETVQQDCLRGVKRVTVAGHKVADPGREVAVAAAGR